MNYFDRTPSPTRATRLSGVVRVVAYLGALGSCFACWSLRAYFNEAELSLARVGDKLAAELGPSLIGAPHVLSVNGQLLLVASQLSPRGVHDVLDAFDRQCVGASPKLVGEALSQLAPGDRAGPDASDAALSSARWEFQHLFQMASQLSVLRSESPEEGYLTCLARPRERIGLTALGEDLNAFVASGDLSRLGELRYVRVRAQKGGGSHVLVVWSEGPFSLRAFVPGAGDAPGVDVPDLPRPRSSRRLYSVQGVGHGFGFWLYASSESGAQQLSFYDRALTSRGFARVEVELAGAQDGASIVRAFVREGRALVLTFTDRAQAGSELAVVDMGRVQRAQIVERP